MFNFLYSFFTGAWLVKWWWSVHSVRKVAGLTSLLATTTLGQSVTHNCLYDVMWRHV